MKLRERPQELWSITTETQIMWKLETVWTCGQNQACSQPIMGPMHKLATATVTHIIRGGKEQKQRADEKHITRRNCTKKYRKTLDKNKTKNKRNQNHKKTLDAKQF